MRRSSILAFYNNGATQFSTEVFDDDGVVTATTTNVEDLNLSTGSVLQPGVYVPEYDRIFFTKHTDTNGPTSIYSCNKGGADVQFHYTSPSFASPNDGLILGLAFDVPNDLLYLDIRVFDSGVATYYLYTLDLPDYDNLTLVNTWSGGDPGVSPIVLYEGAIYKVTHSGDVMQLRKWDGAMESLVLSSIFDRSAHGQSVPPRQFTIYDGHAYFALAANSPTLRVLRKVKLLDETTTDISLPAHSYHCVQVFNNKFYLSGGAYDGADGRISSMALDGTDLEVIYGPVPISVLDTLIVFESYFYYSGPGTKYSAQWAGMDGFFYSLDISKEGYTGDYTFLPVSRDRPPRMIYGQGGAPDIYEPMPGSRLEVTVADPASGTLSEVLVSPDGTYKALLRRFDAYYPTQVWDIWQGYVYPDVFTDPDLQAVPFISFECYDGFGLLVEEDYDPPASQSVYLLLKAARDLVGMTDLTALMNWVPFIEEGDQLTTSHDPLGRLRTQIENWVDAETDEHVNLRDALLTALRAFLMRLFQSRAAWYAVARHELIEGSMFAWVYDSVTRTEMTDWLWDTEQVEILLANQHREIHPPVKAVTAVYELEDPFPNLIFNPGYEVQGATAADAKDWGFDTGAERQGYDVNIGGPSSLFALAVETITGATSSAAVQAFQSGKVVVPHNPAYEYTLKGLCMFYGSPSWNDQAKLLVSVGAGANVHYLTRYSFDVVLDASDFQKVVHVDPITDTGWATGTIIVPRGATMYFYEIASANVIKNKVTLSRSIKVGDQAIYGQFERDVDIEVGDRVALWVWLKPENGGASSGMFPIPHATAYTVKEVWHPIEIPTRLQSPFGDDVYGPHTLSIYEASATGAFTGLNFWDNWEVQILFENAPISEMQFTASRLTSGRVVDLKPVRLGDGPTESEITRLTVIAPSADEYETNQGLDTGWKSGYYASGEESSGYNLHELRAKTVLDEQAVSLERRLLTFALRDQESYAPHEVIKHYQRNELAEAASSGTNLIRTRIPLRPGDVVTITDGVNEETHTVLAVTSDGPWLTALNGSLTGDFEAGASIMHHRLYWWDFIDMDLVRGHLALHMTELYRPSDSIMEYGSLHLKDGSTSEAIATTPAKFTGFATDGPASSNVTVDNSDDDITVAVAGTYLVLFSLTAILDTNGETVTFHIRVNDSEVTGLPGASHHFATGANAGSLSAMGLVSLSASDVVTVYKEASSDALNITPQQAALIVMQIA